MKKIILAMIPIALLVACNPTTPEEKKEYVTITFEMNDKTTDKQDVRSVGTGLSTYTYKVEKGKAFGELITVPRTNFKGYWANGTFYEGYSLKDVAFSKDTTVKAEYNYDYFGGEFCPLTISAGVDKSTVQLKVNFEENAELYDINIECQINTIEPNKIGEWHTFLDYKASSGERKASSEIIELNDGDEISFRSSLNSNRLAYYGDNINDDCNVKFELKKPESSTSNEEGFALSGCIDSLVNFSSTLCPGAFNSLFAESDVYWIGEEHMFSHYKNNLSKYCFYNMFYDCTSLEGLCYDEAGKDRVYVDLSTDNPVEECYAYMFSGCSSLKYAPNVFIKFNELNENVNCCSGMFKGLNEGFEDLMKLNKENKGGRQFFYATGLSAEKITSKHSLYDIFLNRTSFPSGTQIEIKDNQAICYSDSEIE